MVSSAYVENPISEAMQRVYGTAAPASHIQEPAQLNGLSSVCFLGRVLLIFVVVLVSTVVAV